MNRFDAGPRSETLEQIGWFGVTRSVLNYVSYQLDHRSVLLWMKENYEI